MATTISRATSRKKDRQSVASWIKRSGELAGLIAASIVFIVGSLLVYQAKTSNPEKVSFEDVETKLKSKQVINLNTLANPADLLPLLAFYDSEADRNFVAQKIFEAVIRYKRQLQNVGELRKLLVARNEIDSNPGLSLFKQRLIELRRQENAQTATPKSPETPIPLLTAKQFSQLKPLLVVRNPEDIRSSLFKWAMIFLLVFYGIHFAWVFLGFKGDQLMLPVIHLLSGLGLILMVTLRDPLRDTVSFNDFALGLAGGCALLFISSLLDFQSLLSKISIIPLWLALGLSALLIMFGSGPGASDAKVNLFGMQPVELIRILVVLFLAGYFAENWEFLRELKAKGHGLFAILRRWNVPSLNYFLPVIIAMSVVLCFFFLQKDLGPALVLGCTFLAMYAVARKRSFLVAVGLLILMGGVWIGYRLVWPLTVYQRIRIWVDVWDNGLRNGDQIAQAWWALATGSLTGTGLGMGDTSLIPAGHTDLIVASLGEELGFVGVTIVILLYALLILRGLRIALRSESAYTFFLALGLSLITAFQIALIIGGILGLLPLSGVVSPFLSYGKSSMLANCLVFGILFSISSRPAEPRYNENFRLPLKRLAVVLGAIAIALFLRTGYVQVIRADTNIVRPVLTKQADNIYRYIYNPRILDAARLLPQGSIYDRNGIPLATSNWAELDRFRQQYEELGINIDVACPKPDSRCYPFGPALFHLLGNSLTRDNWAASNSSYIERDYLGRLRGFDNHAEMVVKSVVEVDMKTRELAGKEVTVLRRDFTEILPLLRYRYRPGQADVQNLLRRERNVKMSIDVRLQLRTAEIIKQQIRAAGREKGAAVILDPETGDLLAIVSYPWPIDKPRPPVTQWLNDFDDEIEPQEEYLDRARYGQYPPGSTFKVVTAVAALRKDPQLVNKPFDCKPLGDGRVGNFIQGWSRPIRDDVGDAAHGSVSMEKGIVESCNAYFAQLATYEVGSSLLLQTAKLFEIEVAQPNTPDQLGYSLPQAAYGQGQIVVTPFQMARVSATIANNGRMSYGRWVIDDSNQRVKEPQLILNRDLTALIAQSMRGVVERGTATILRNISPPIYGKTGTAQVKDERSHSWFIGFAPEAGSKKIAFAIVIENGGYGGEIAAPVAGELVKTARTLQLIQ